ncbi:MAG: PIG-L family deacetylase [Chloroflexi bacterium]|nr:PIG-L family deacetylase [Chloroflexota bacterium]
MSTGYRLLAVFAHPDDESRIVGGALAKYAGEGVQVCLSVGTKGEAATLLGDPPVCTIEELPQVRKKELEEACRVLGIAGILAIAASVLRGGKLPEAARGEVPATQGKASKLRE